MSYSMLRRLLDRGEKDEIVHTDSHVVATILELTVLLAEGTGLAEEVNEAVSTRSLLQVVLTPQL